MGLIDRSKRAAARARRSDEKVTVLEAGRTLFGEQPYDRVTLHAVAQRAKVRPGMPSLFFGSEQGLFLASLAAELELWAAELTGEGTAPRASRAEVAASLAGARRLTRMLASLHLALSEPGLAEPGSLFMKAREEALARVGGALVRAGAARDEAQALAALRRALVYAAGIEACAQSVPWRKDAAAFDAKSELERLLDAELEAAPGR